MQHANLLLQGNSTLPKGMAVPISITHHIETALQLKWNELSEPALETAVPMVWNWPAPILTTYHGPLLRRKRRFRGLFDPGLN